MQHPLQISRRIEYGLRAMVYLASTPAGTVVPFREIARKMDAPSQFLAKIMKVLSKAGLTNASRGTHGGYTLARPANTISMLDVIEAVEGRVLVNVCTDTHSACNHLDACTMLGVWRLGQERMLEVYRHAKLDKLAMSGFAAVPVIAALGASETRAN